MSMIRKLMRNVARSVGKRSALGGAPAVGSVRAGMHQQAEHEYQRSRMADNEHHEETPEDALDMPAAVEAEIPPVEEEDDEVAADVADGEAEIAPEEEILEDVADPESSEEEEDSGQPAAGSGQLNCDASRHFGDSRAQLAYGEEALPVLDPVTGGNGTDGSAELVYDPGDGSLKEIQEPLPGMERLGVLPFIPGMQDPSANVPASDPEPTPEPTPEPEPSE